MFICSKYTDKESLQVALKNIGFIGGTTYTNEALLKADEVLSGADGRRSQASPIIVVFTDGFSHDDPASGKKINSRNNRCRGSLHFSFARSTLTLYRFQRLVYHSSSIMQYHIAFAMFR